MSKRVAIAFTGPSGSGKTTLQSLNISHAMTEGPAVDYAIQLCASDPRINENPLELEDEWVSWLTCDPVEGRVEPGTGAVLSLEFSSMGLPVGAHTCWLAIRAEGFLDPAVVPVMLHVTSNGKRCLQGSHPNPFNPVTWIRFDLSSEATVQVDVLDVRGRLVRRLLNDIRGAGSHRVAWDGRDDAGAPLAAGLYLARLRTQGDQFTCKMILAK